MSQGQEGAERLERLLDAIDLIKEDRRSAALPILRGLIRDDKDHEEAWLWMSVAVESVDQSILCLDNVLRINPKNSVAAGALYRLRRDDMTSQKRRSQLRNYRDLATIILWLLILGSLFSMWVGFFRLSLVGVQTAG